MILQQPFFLSLLILIPIFSYFVTRRKFPDFLGRAVGASFGAIVSPWALGLYSFYFLSPWGVVPGMLGLVLTLVHGVPGFKIAVALELIPREVVSGMASQVIIESINGAVWALLYGLIGLTIDKARKRKKRVSPA